MQLLLALFFYAVFSLFAGIGLPFTLRLIPNKTVAYLLAKPLGLVLFGYLVWLLSSMHILNYQWKPVILILFLAAATTGIWYSQGLPATPVTNNKKAKPAQPWYRTLLKIEAVSLAVYLAYLWLRSYHATINGTESFMDLAMLQASGKTDFFPFIDPWYAGKAVNYYYYGSYLVSLVSNLARVPYALAYNFALGLWYAEAAMLAGAFVWLLSASKKFAVLAAFLVTTAGTLFYAGCVINAASKPGGVCSYASSTRLYTPSYIINEIPSYSFTVGDLHAHLLALPFFLMNLFLIWKFYQQEKAGRMLPILLAIGFATSGMTSTWDLITLASLLLVAATAKEFKRRREFGPSYSWWRQFGSCITAAAVAIGGAVVLMYPLLRAYQSPTVGLGFTPAFVKLHNLRDIQYPTPLLAELGMWGAFLALAVLVLVAFRRKLRDFLFPVVLGIVALGIIVGVEFLFVGDIYSIANPPFFRANTTFKFGYHAWTLLSLVVSILLAAAFAEKNRTRTQRYVLGVASVLLAVTVAGGLYYPYQAIAQFYLPQSQPRSRSLDGSKWMQETAPGDAATVRYINNTVRGRAVIAEAVGDSYTSYSRITTFTGQITPMGWKTHEWTWRFQGALAKRAPVGRTVETGWGAVAQVSGDVQRLYETADAAETQRIINQYHISYVYVGDLERSTYPQLNEQKFARLGQLVFESGNSRLYKVEPR